MFGKAGLFLVEVHRHQLEIDRRGGLQVAQDVQKGVAVFAAGEADHDFVALFNHIEIVNRLAHGVAQAFVQFVGFVFVFGLIGHNGVSAT